MLRSEVLRLYRDMLRVVRQVPGTEQREELRKWIRTDFDNNKHHTDEVRFFTSVLFVCLFVCLGCFCVSVLLIFTFELPTILHFII